MITVHCPTCAATYKLDPAKIGPNGRKLKCAKCATVWVATADEPAPVPPAEAPEAPAAAVPSVEDAAPQPPVAEVEPSFSPTEIPEFREEVIARLPQPDLDGMTQLGRRRFALSGETLWLLVGALVVVAGAMAAVGVYWNTLPKTVKSRPVKVARADKPLEMTYGEAPKGIMLHRVKGDVLDVSGSAVLQVTGMVTNTGQDPVALSSLRLELVGEDDKVADAWPIPNTSTTLAPQADQAFAVSLTSPALADAKGWRVVFP